MPSNKPLNSNFAEDGSLDTSLTLAHGSVTVTTSLTSGMDDSQTFLLMDNGSGSPRDGGILVLEEEIIFFSSFSEDDSDQLWDLVRGQLGTTPSSHLTGAEVKIYGRPRFGNPAIGDSILALQEMVLDLQSRVAILEGA